MVRKIGDCLLAWNLGQAERILFNFQVQLEFQVQLVPMPIRFVCEHCQQRLSVSSKRAGARSKCPRCKEVITVPDDPGEKDAVTSEERENEQAAETVAEKAAAGVAESDDPFAQFSVFDDDAEWVVESDDSEPTPVGLDTGMDPEKLAVSRQLVYMQGVLLAIVAVVCFALGVVVGGNTMRGPVADSATPMPCWISGKVTFRTENGSVIPDDGAVIVVLPRDTRPEQKAEVDGLVPDAPAPIPNDPGLLAIQSIGGEYARVDVNGQFRIRVPDRGKYYLLVLSRKARRDPGDSLRRSDLAQLGNFFTPATELLGANQYRWQEQSIRRDVTVDFEFE